MPEHAEFLASVPELLSRVDVVRLNRNASADPTAAIEGFLAAMIWGYGTRGYGPFRTNRVLTKTPNATQTLAELATIARREGGPAAFDWLTRSDNRLRFLGTAFATKYLYFCGANGNGDPALILDNLVANWLRDHTGWRISLNHNAADYRAFVETMSRWANDLDIQVGDLEMVIFQLAANGQNSPWKAPDFFGYGPTGQQA